MELQDSWRAMESPYFARWLRVWQHFLSFQLSRGDELHVVNAVGVLTMLRVLC